MGPRINNHVGVYMERLVNFSPYSWSVIDSCVNFMNSSTVVSLNSIRKTLSRKVSLKLSQLIKDASVLIYSFHGV